MYKIEKQFKNADQLIKVFKWFLIILLCIVAFTELSNYPVCSCLSISCIGNFFNALANITKNAIPLLAALLATFVADRHIVYTSRNRDYDQAFEIQRITHHHIAISKDLREKINYLKVMCAGDKHDIHAYTTIIESIEKRYETLFDKEAYKYLDGKTVDKINSMSATIFGLRSRILSLEKTPIAQSNAPLPPIPFPPEVFDKLTKTINSILEDLVELKNNMFKEL